MVGDLIATLSRSPGASEYLKKHFTGLGLDPVVVGGMFARIPASSSSPVSGQDEEKPKAILFKKGQRSEKSIWNIDKEEEEKVSIEQFEENLKREVKGWLAKHGKVNPSSSPAVNKDETPRVKDTRQIKAHILRTALGAVVLLALTWSVWPAMFPALQSAGAALQSVWVAGAFGVVAALTAVVSFKTKNKLYIAMATVLTAVVLSLGFGAIPMGVLSIHILGISSLTWGKLLTLVLGFLTLNLMVKLRELFRGDIPTINIRNVTQNSLEETLPQINKGANNPELTAIINRRDKKEMARALKYISYHAYKHFVNTPKAGHGIKQGEGWIWQWLDKSVLRIGTARELVDAVLETRSLIVGLLPDRKSSRWFVIALIAIPVALLSGVYFVGKITHEFFASAATSMIDFLRAKQPEQLAADPNIRIYVQAAMSDLNPTTSWQKVKAPWRRLNVELVAFGMAHPLIYGNIIFIKSRLVLVVLSYYLTPILITAFTAVWFSGPLWAKVLLVPAVPIYYTLKGLAWGVNGMFNGITGWSSNVGSFLLKHIQPTLENIMRVFVLNFVLQYLRQVNTIKNRVIIDYLFAKRFALPTLAVETLAVHTANWIAHPAIREAYKQGYLYAEYDASLLDVLRRQYEPRGWKGRITTQMLTVPAVFVYLINTYLPFNWIAKLFGVSDSRLVRAFEELGKAKVTFISGGIGLSLISAEIATAIGLTEIVGGPLEHIGKAWEGPNGIIGIGSDIVGSVEAYAAETYGEGKEGLGHDIHEGYRNTLSKASLADAYRQYREGKLFEFGGVDLMKAQKENGGRPLEFEQFAEAIKDHKPVSMNIFQWLRYHSAIGDIVRQLGIDTNPNAENKEARAEKLAQVMPLYIHDAMKGGVAAVTIADGSNLADIAEEANKMEIKAKTGEAVFATVPRAGEKTAFIIKNGDSVTYVTVDGIITKRLPRDIKVPEFRIVETDRYLEFRRTMATVPQLDDSVAAYLKPVGLTRSEMTPAEPIVARVDPAISEYESKNAVVLLLSADDLTSPETLKKNLSAVFGSLAKFKGVAQDKVKLLLPSKVSFDLFQGHFQKIQKAGEPAPEQSTTQPVDQTIKQFDTLAGLQKIVQGNKSLKQAVDSNAKGYDYESYLSLKDAFDKLGWKKALSEFKDFEAAQEFFGYVLLNDKEAPFSAVVKIDQLKATKEKAEHKKVLQIQQRGGKDEAEAARINRELAADDGRSGVQG